MSSTHLIIPCTLLQPGYSLIPKVDLPKSEPEDQLIQCESVEDKYHDFKYLETNPDILYAYNSVTEEETDWSEWNTKEDGTNLEDVLTKPTLLIFTPEYFQTGIIDPEQYSPIEHLAEIGFEEFKELGKILYTEVKKIIEPKQYHIGQLLEIKLDPKADKWHKVVTRPWIDFRFLSEWNWWDSKSWTDYGYEYDSGLDFVKFVDI